MSSLLTVVVTGILSGGLGAGVAALIVGRATAKKTNSEGQAIDAKTPVEVDSIAVQGAETAVLTMQRALESAEARIAELTRDRAADRKRIVELEAKVDELRSKVNAAEEATASARRAGEELRSELRSFIEEQGNRR